MSISTQDFRYVYLMTQSYEHEAAITYLCNIHSPRRNGKLRLDSELGSGLDLDFQKHLLVMIFNLVY